MIGLFTRFFFALVSLTLCAPCAIAKRVSPKPVAPVISGKIKYSADGDGRDASIVATDLSNGKTIWRVEVFHNRIKPWIEEDVQWVYITHPKLTGKSLLVMDEKSRCYSIDTKNKRARSQACEADFL
jgi:hypothetical protein